MNNDKARKEFHRGMSGLTRLDETKYARLINPEMANQQRINALNEEKEMHKGIGGYNNSYVIQQSIIDNHRKLLAREQKAFDSEYEEATLKYEKLERNYRLK